MRTILAAFALLLAVPALAADVSGGWPQGPGGFYNPADRSGPYAIDGNGTAKLIGSGPTVGTPGFAASQATATATAAQIVAARPSRGAVTVENTGTTPVYLGPSGVTTGTGFLLPGVVGASVTIPTAAPIYAVTGSGSQALSIIETF